MKVRRFRVDDLAGDRIKVTGEEAIHALRVLRLGAGSEVNLFDGRGHEVTGRIVAAAAGQFEVEILTRRHVDPPALAALTIAAATPKGDRADWLIEKCAELDVRSLIPLLCERSAVRPGEGKLVRWRRKAVEAAKQSGRSLAMVVEPPVEIATLLANSRNRCSVWYGDAGPRIPAFSEVLSELQAGTGSVIEGLLLIGPEGGFTPAEIETIQRSGGRPVRLAATILRVETAAVAAAAIWSSWSLRLSEA